MYAPLPPDLKDWLLNAVGDADPSGLQQRQVLDALAAPSGDRSWVALQARLAPALRAELDTLDPADRPATEARLRAWGLLA